MQFIFEHFLMRISTAFCCCSSAAWRLFYSPELSHPDRFIAVREGNISRLLAPLAVRHAAFSNGENIMDEQTFSTGGDACYRCVSQERVDSYGHSETLICNDCGLHTLAIDWSHSRVEIPLVWLSKPWEKKPGDSDITEAERLVASLVWGQTLHPLTRLRYGLNTPECCEVLSSAVAQGVTAYDLNRVRCDGWAIRRLVESVPDVGHCPEFVTWFDEVEAANSLPVAK